MRRVAAGAGSVLIGAGLTLGVHAYEQGHNPAFEANKHARACAALLGPAAYFNSLVPDQCVRYEDDFTPGATPGRYNLPSQQNLLLAESVPEQRIETIKREALAVEIAGGVLAAEILIVANEVLLYIDHRDERLEAAEALEAPGGDIRE